MKDESEQSNPSRGSLEEGPVAWMQPNQRDLYVSDERDQWHTVPLYRSPTLTDAERKAISRIYDLLNERSRELQAARRIEESTPYVQLAKTLQTMWERLK